jgi:hypothetical protein
MWWVLQTDGQIKISITKNCTKMFWLGYFLRKSMQEENLIKVMARNKDEEKKWIAEHEIDIYY